MEIFIGFLYAYPNFNTLFIPRLYNFEMIWNLKRYLRYIPGCLIDSTYSRCYISLNCYPSNKVIFKNKILITN